MARGGASEAHRALPRLAPEALGAKDRRREIAEPAPLHRRDARERSGVRRRPRGHREDLPRRRDGDLAPEREADPAHPPVPPGGRGGEKLGFLPGRHRGRRSIRTCARSTTRSTTCSSPSGSSSWSSAARSRSRRSAFMRGRTLNDAFIILDEAQNTTPEQMKMFLTRIGLDSKAAVTGDVTQIDLPAQRDLRARRGAGGRFGDPGIAIVHFDKTDVVRHPLVQRIVVAYDERDARIKGARVTRSRRSGRDERRGAPPLPARREVGLCSSGSGCAGRSKSSSARTSSWSGRVPRRRDPAPRQPALRIVLPAPGGRRAGALRRSRDRGRGRSGRDRDRRAARRRAGPHPGRLRPRHAEGRRAREGLHRGARRRRSSLPAAERQLLVGWLREVMQGLVIANKPMLLREKAITVLHTPSQREETLRDFSARSSISMRRATTSGSASPSLDSLAPSTRASLAELLVDFLDANLSEDAAATPRVATRRSARSCRCRSGSRKGRC